MRMRLLALGVSLLCGGLARAATPDQTFVDKAAAGGMAEVELGRLAEKTGVSAQVKQFAKKMVTDHTKANAELKALATKKNIALPGNVTAEQRATYDRLATLAGAAFDSGYMDVMKKDHDDTVQLFKTESESGQDADLKAWATKTLPTLQSHDHLAHDYGKK